MNFTKNILVINLVNSNSLINLNEYNQSKVQTIYIYKRKNIQPIQFKRKELWEIYVDKTSQNQSSNQKG